ncbi:MAG: hypothetical protein AAEJ65_07785 [Planctomycetota bacterium]
MFRNALVTIGLLWFSLAPTLCAAGVLSHACDSPINFKYETCCVNIEHDCFEHGRSHDGCSHDNGSHDACANDPCQGQVVVEKVRDEGFQCSNHDALGGLDSVIDGQLSTFRTRPHANFGRHGAGKKLPYPPSDMPLRA